MRNETAHTRRCWILALAMTAGTAGVAAGEPATRPITRPDAAAVRNVAVDVPPENRALAERVGQWDVTETIWPAPGADPIVTTGLTAERRMVGQALNETLRRPAGTPGEPIERVDYRRFNHLSGQWEYTSLDTRVDIGLMPAKSFTRAGPDGRIVLVHEPFVIPGNGPGQPPVTLRMTSTIIPEGPDHDRTEQHFVATDGTGRVWLAHRYDYARQK